MEGMQEVIKIAKSEEEKRSIWHKVLTIASIFLFGILCFGLGRLSKIEESKPDLVIEQTLQTAQTIQTVQTSTKSPLTQTSQTGARGEYVASKNGTKYYLPNCSGVKRIAEANKIWFATKADAEARGLTPAANCPGL